MAKSITIRLLPPNKNNLYKPKPGFTDLYILMNKLHLSTVNEAIEEEKETISELELERHKIKQTIDINHQEESTMTVIENCLEKVDKSIKKEHLKQKMPDINNSQIEEINKIIEESELVIKDKLKRLNLEDLRKNPSKFINDIKNNLTLINKRKTSLKETNNNLMLYMSKLEIVKENLSSSSTDIDTLEIAIKTLK
jgi:hypothetical protein